MKINETRVDISKHDWRPPPVVGEIRRGKDIGRKHSAQRYSWRICSMCGLGRWIATNDWRIGRARRCYRCRNRGLKKPSGDKHWNWKGGVMTTNGYRWIKLYPDNDFYSMVSGSGHYVREHRLAMAVYLGRCLYPWEVVHHINGDKLDNCINNLMLLGTIDEHLPYTSAEKLLNKIRQMHDRISLLEQENTRLRNLLENYG